MDFYNPVNIVTGEGCVHAKAALMTPFGTKCMIVTGKTSAVRSGALADMQSALDGLGIKYCVFDETEPNPLVATCYRAGNKAREFDAEFIIGIGGGSPLDAAKAVAVFAANAMDNCMNIYSGAWPNPVLPVIAVGTTAGTGSEVNHFSVLTKPDGIKQSIGSIDLIPKIAFGDPKYTYSLPLAFTVSTGLDALSHSLEGYFNKNANDMSDMFAVRAATLLMQALSELETVTDEQMITVALREKLYYASVFAGMVLRHAGTCYCHRIGYHLTEQYDVAHGTACAVFLPDFIRRATRLLPQRTKTFFEDIRSNPESLCGLIERLTTVPDIKLDTATMLQIAERGNGSPNFMNTAPNGYTSEETVQLLTTLFG